MISERVAGIGTAVDLGSDDILADAKRRRHLAQHTERVDQAVRRLEARARQRQARAFRTRIGSNGRAECVREAQFCTVLAELLRKALNGDDTPKFHAPASASRQVQATVTLLHELQAV